MTTQLVSDLAITSTLNLDGTVHPTNTILPYRKGDIVSKEELTDIAEDVLSNHLTVLDETDLEIITDTSWEEDVSRLEAIWEFEHRSI